MNDELDLLLREAELKKRAGGKVQDTRVEFKDVLAGFMGGDEEGKYDDVAAGLRREAGYLRRRQRQVEKIVISDHPENN